MTKTSKHLLVLLLVAVLSVALVLSVACNKDPEIGTEWIKDAEGHWHIATNEGFENEKYDYATHVFGADNKCSVCGYEKVVSGPIDEPVAVTGVSLNASVLQLTTVGNGRDSIKLVANVQPQNASDKALTWESSNKSVATVSDGTVTSVGVGQATITVTTHDGNKSATCEISVVNAKLPSASDYVDDNPVPDADGKILVAMSLNVTTALQAKTYTDGWDNGVFGLGAKTTVRSRTKAGVYNDVFEKISDVTYTQSIQFNSSDSAIILHAGAAGTLTLHAQFGSSGLDNVSMNLIRMADVEGEKDADPIVFTYPGDSNNRQTQEVKVEIPEAGNYKITRGESKTTDVYYVAFEAKFPPTAIDQINVANEGTVDFLVGQPLDLSDVALSAVHKENGRVSSVNAGLAIFDLSNCDNTHAGTYEVGISYTDADGTYNTKMSIKYYDLDSITLGFNAIIKNKQNSAAGNGVLANHAVQQLYMTGESLNLDGLTVTAIGKLAQAEGDPLTCSFKLAQDAYSAGDVDLTTAGEKTVTISYTTNSVTKTAEFQVYVMQAIDLSSAQSVVVDVDASYDGAIGAKVGDNYKVKTIQQAMELLQNSKIPAAATKTINVAAGTYTEKVEVIVPNVTIIGADKNTTVIEWDALYGQLDESGFKHETDSTATLNVRDTAVGFRMENITVNNKYMTQEYFNQVFGKDSNGKDLYGEHRALAVLIQADKVVIDNCILNGYQDTIELFTGRQYIVNTLITGSTDFIFGTNNTTYFYNCEIRSIKVHDSTSNGGYVTAFKGYNKSNDKSAASYDAIIYGAIFDQCNFTAEEGLAAGKTALGRNWGENAAVMIMNSNLGAHISKGTGTARNNRYVVMSGALDIAKFTEYGNSGAGAISADQAGVKVLSTADALKYRDFAVIFGQTNGAVSYADAWVPYTTQAATVNVHVGSAEAVSYNSIAGRYIAQSLIDAQFTVPANSIVAGYYKDSAYTQPYVFGTDKLVAGANEVYVKIQTQDAVVKVQFQGEADPESETLNWYSGEKVTAAQLAALYEIEDTTKVLDGYYKDAACTQPWNVATDVLVSGDNVIYIKLKEKPTSQTYTFVHGEENSEEWSIKNPDGNNNSSKDDPAVPGAKILDNTVVTLNVAGSGATISMSGFTTATSSAAEYVVITFHAEDGTVVGTIKGTTTKDKLYGDFTLADDGVFEGDFAYIEITCGTSGKHFSIVELEIEVDF